MDPDATLREIREIVEHFDGNIAEFDRLIELVQGLDDWITTGGFLPRDWQRKVSLFK